MSHGKTNSVKRILAVLTLSATLVSPASSYTLYGNGTLTCAEMTEEYDKYREPSDIIKHWIYGYVSGRNYENDSDKGSGNFKAFYSAVLQDCRQNPLDKVIDAANRLYYKLR